MSEEVIRPAASGTDHHTVCGTADELTARVCSKCRETKLLSEFAKDWWMPQGRRGMCALCRVDYDRERDYIRRCRKYGHHPVIEHFTAQQLAERHGDRCFYCGAGAFECVDHLVCVRVGGCYTVGNIVRCCRECNQRKRWAVDEPRIRAFRARLTEQAA